MTSSFTGRLHPASPISTNLEFGEVTEGRRGQVVDIALHLEDQPRLMTMDQRSVPE